MPNDLKASVSCFYEDRKVKSKKTVCFKAHISTYVVKKGGKPISINLEVAVKKTLQQTFIILNQNERAPIFEVLTTWKW